MALTGDGEGRMRNDPLVISSIRQPIRGGWQADWPIRGLQGPPAPVSSMSINNTKLTSVLRRREKTQQILSTSKNTSLEIWLMDLMNERRRVNSGKHFSKGFWNNFKYFKENLKLSHPDISWNPIRDDIIIIQSSPATNPSMININDIRTRIRVSKYK